MRSNLHIAFLWPSPGQYVSSGVYVPVENAPTRTAMNTNSQRLPHYLPALAALLAGVLWVNQYHLGAGAFSLAYQDAQETGPAGICDTARQPAVLHHPLDVEAFRSDGAVSVNQRTSGLVVHVPADFSHLCMESSDPTLNTLAAIAAAFAPSQCPLMTAKLWQGTFKRTAITERFTVGCGNETIKANVDANSIGLGSGCGARYFYGEHCIPLSGIPQYGQGLNLSIFRQLPVPLDADGADVLEAQFVSDQLEAIVDAVGKRIESVCTFESRVSGFRSDTASAEEGRESLIQLAERLFGRLRVDAGKIRAESPLNCKPAGLLEIAPILSSRFPTQELAVKRTVVEMAMRFERGCQLSFLVGVCPQAKLVHSQHAFSIAIPCWWGGLN
jgi:hypothetical protein